MNESFSELNSCIPELRYIYFHLSARKRSNYINYAKSDIINCLQRTALNLLYAKQAKISLSKSQVALLKNCKKKLKDLVSAKTIKEKKRILTNGFIEKMLKVILSKRVLRQIGLD